MEAYRDPSLSPEVRTADLLSRMTLEEKILQTDQFSLPELTERGPDGRAASVSRDRLVQLTGGRSVGSIQVRGASPALINRLQRHAVEETRLGIPFLFSEEALHGFFDRDATCFPQQIGLAGTFRPELGARMGRAIAAEARAYGVHETFSPVLDLTWDPRYGRTEEALGEDPFLAGEFAREIVRGMQGEDLRRPDTVAAEPKHFCAYGTPVGGLNCAPSAMGRHDVFARCLPVFEQAFTEGGAWNAMCSYASIDGTPVASDRELLTDVLRGQYHMPGFVRSDMTAVLRLYGSPYSHYTAATRTEAIRQGLEAGVDLQLFDFPHREWMEAIRGLIEGGEMARDVLDTACGRVLRLKFALGLFERPYVDETLYVRTANCPAHQAAALEIARQSLCLLKNQGDLLPLADSCRVIAVTGPGAAEPVLGDYCVDFDPSHMVTVLEGIRRLAGPERTVLYEKGCETLGEQALPFPEGWLLDEEGAPGLTGRYYNGWDPAEAPAAVRRDPAVRFNWIYARPHPDVDGDRFRVEWTGRLRPDESFQGCLAVPGQDSMRLYIDGALLVDAWEAPAEADRTADFLFQAGREYALRLVFRNDARGAQVVFGYNRGRENWAPALAMARRADVTIACLGDSLRTSGENFDRAELTLPGRQLDFLKALAAQGTPVVLVLQNGRPLNLSWEQGHIPAILECWFPGEKGGQAVAEVLFGQTAPSGRLPMSFPRSVGQVPCVYNRLPGGGVRYVEMDAAPLYPFGFGLTYTRFAYSGLDVRGDGLSAREIEEGAKLLVSFTVTNTGDRPGEETAQLYLRDLASSTVKPERELAGFQKFPLQPGESRRVELRLGRRQLRTLGRDYVWRVEPGRFRVMAGDNAANILLEQEFEIH